jgi:hypothetical protein
MKREFLRSWYGIIGTLVGLSLAGCGSSSTNSAIPSATLSSSLSCTVSGTVSSNMVSGLVIDVFNGVGPYNVTLPNGVVISSSSLTSTSLSSIEVSYTYAASVALNSQIVYVTDTSNSASTSCVLSSTSGTTVTTPLASNLTCTLYHTAGYYYAGQSVPFYISTNTGEQIEITYVSLGESDYFSPGTFPMILPNIGSLSEITATFSYSGNHTVQIQALSVSRPGVMCNGGVMLTDSIYIN